MNMFDKTKQKWGNSAYVMWVFAVGVMMLIIGIVLFIEDTMSSLQGIQQLETVYGIDPVNIPAAYYAVALAPQIAQIAFMMLFVSDTKKNRWALIVLLIAFAIDFLADVQDRSASWLFSASGVNMDARVGVAAVLSLIFFTAGSELFISTGLGLVLALYQSAHRQYNLMFGRKQKGTQPQPYEPLPSHNNNGRGRDNAGQPRVGRNSDLQMQIDQLTLE